MADDVNDLTTVHRGEPLVRHTDATGWTSEYFRRKFKGRGSVVYARVLRKDGTPFSPKFWAVNGTKLLILLKAGLEV